MGRPRGSSCQGGGSRGGPGREVVTLRCCGLSEVKGRMDGKEGRGMKGGRREHQRRKGKLPTEKCNLGRQGGGGWRQPGQAGGRKGKLGYHA